MFASKAETLDKNKCDSVDYPNLSESKKIKYQQGKNNIDANNDQNMTGGKCIALQTNQKLNKKKNFDPEELSFFWKSHLKV